MKKLFVSFVGFLVTGWGLKVLIIPVRAATPVSSHAKTTVALVQPQNVQPQIELLDPGAEPRQELRFKPAVNSKETATMTMNINMVVSIGGNSAPQLQTPSIMLTMNTLVNQVDPNGDIHYQFFYSDAKVVPQANTPPQLLKVMQNYIKNLVGIRGSGIVDNRGQTKAYSITLPAGIDPTTKQIIQQMSNSTEQLSSPVPAQPVGVGARWRVVSSARVNQLNLNQVSTYQLQNRQNNVLTLNVSTTQQAGEQSLNQPGLPAGYTSTLKSLTSQGQGQVTMELNRLLPVNSNITVHSNSQIEARRGGQPTTINSVSIVQVSIKSQ